MNEIWKDVPTYEGLYQVSDLGMVRSKRCLLVLSITHGYKVVTLSSDGMRRSMKVHVLVAMAFLGHIPNGNKLVVNHKDFNKLNNIKSNLEVVTQRENTNKKHIPHSSQYTGVIWRKAQRKWNAYITIDYKKKYLGSFINEYDAHKAYENTLKTIS